MIDFVNAKINIGLQIVRRRKDGYHDLQTIFYPIGLYNGSPENPEPFCDILEISKSGMSKVTEPEFIFSGRRVDCPPEKNLVVRAAMKFAERFEFSLEGLRIQLDKHIPDGAGIGGGSADATFMLRLLREHSGRKISDEELAEVAAELGADCPFFVYNRPLYASGTGNIFSTLDLDLSGKWLLLVKPDVYVSTAQAFAKVHPREPEFDLREISKYEISQWEELIFNDFEESIFPQFPVLASIKESIRQSGALYCSMSGSGSSLYGIYEDFGAAEKAKNEFISKPTIEGTYLLKL